MQAPAVSTCLWFDDQAEPAAALYCSLFDDATITSILRQHGDAQNRAFTVAFTLMGQEYWALNGGPHVKHGPAASITVGVGTQAKVDHFWNALLDGGAESRCGWLTDRFGLSWQIFPRALPRLLQTEGTGKVMQAMPGMVKLDIAALEAAAYA